MWHAWPTSVVATVLCVLWSLSFVVQKWGLEDSGPLWLAAGRAAAAAVVLLPVVIGGARLGVRGHALAAILGVTNVAGFFALQIAGLERVGAGAAAALVFTQPLIVFALAHVFLGERMTLRRAGGGLIAFSGVAVLGIHEAGAGSLLGVAILLGAALSWAIGTVVLKHAGDLPILRLVEAQAAYGALPLLVLAVAVESPPRATVGLLLCVLYVGVGATAVGWVLLAVLLRRADTGAVSASLFSVPVLGAVLGVVLGGEALHAPLVIAVALVAAGVCTATTGISLRD